MLPILLTVTTTMSEINPSDVEFTTQEATSQIVIADTSVNMDGICEMISFDEYICYDK